MELEFQRNFFIKLKFRKKWHNKFEGYFSKKFEFLELELYAKFKFNKGGRLLNIS